MGRYMFGVCLMALVQAVHIRCHSDIDAENVVAQGCPPDEMITRECMCGVNSCSKGSVCTSGSTCSLPGSTFLVVGGDHVVESFNDIEKAKAKLRKVTTSSRLIAEVDSNGSLKRDPHVVGGQFQVPTEGFNKWWGGWDEINRMMDVAQQFLNNKNDPDVCTGTGAGWTLVRWVPSGGNWHPATDQLRGTEEYGDPADTNQAFSIKFDRVDFDQFLFSTGDCKKWLIASKEQVIGLDGNAFYGAQDRTILKSSTSGSSYEATWLRRIGNLEDPWVSLTDHGVAIRNNEILYGEDGYVGQHAVVLGLHGGAAVFIRKDL